MTAIIAKKYINNNGVEQVNLYADGNTSVGNIIIRNNTKKIFKVGDFFIAGQGLVAAIRFFVHTFRYKVKNVTIDEENIYQQVYGLIISTF